MQRMEFSRRVPSAVHGETVYDEIAREFGGHTDLPPVDIDIERFDRNLSSLASGRTIVPNGLTVEQICEFMDQASKAK